MISFTDSVRAAMAGSCSGSWKADGSRHYLAITPLAAPTATVVTVTLPAGLAASYGLMISDQGQGWHTPPPHHMHTAAWASGGQGGESAHV